MHPVSGRPFVIDAGDAPGASRARASALTGRWGRTPESIPGPNGRDFVGHAVVQRRYRGTSTGIPLLVLVSAAGGNLPTGHWIDDQVFAVTAVYADFFPPNDPLPPHALIVNAIGDADLCEPALVNAACGLPRVAPSSVINAPALVRATGRESVARRLARIPGVIAPRITRLSRADLPFPLLLRAPGYHTGQHFVRS